MYENLYLHVKNISSTQILRNKEKKYILIKPLKECEMKECFEILFENIIEDMYKNQNHESFITKNKM